MAESSQGGFRKLMSGLQSGISAIPKPGGSTFYPTTLSLQKSSKSGWLKKQGGIVKSWHRRWFTLKGDNMYYFSSQDESKSPLGSIFLPGNKVVEHPFNTQEPDKFLFEIVPGGDRSQMTSTHDTYPLCADSDDDRKDWIKSIRKVMYADKGGAIFGQSLEETMRYEQSQGSRMVPLIVERCVDFLKNNALEVEGIFRLPGRSTLVKELREKYDCGEQPDFDMCEMDLHSVASLLKGYLRELPEPIIPVQFYDTVRKVVVRDIHQDPEKAFERMYQLLSNIPQHNYNLLQYICKFLQDVANNSDVNKMTSMNLATVFAQSVVRPEDDDPAIMMGTAQARTQIVFVLISQCDKIFRLEYTPQGGSVLVDNLISIGGEEEEEGEMNGAPTAAAVTNSSSFQNDLIGLEISNQCQSEGALNAEGVRSGLDIQVEVRDSQSTELLMDSTSRESEIDPYMTYTGGAHGPNPTSTYNQMDSEPVYELAADVNRNAVSNDEEDSPSEEQPSYARVNKPANRRAMKHRSVKVYSEAQTLPLPPEEEDEPAAAVTAQEPVPPPPPPRPMPRAVLVSNSSVESIDVPAFSESSSEDDQALENLINMDLTGFGQEDLLAHIQTLCSELRNQRSKVIDLQNSHRELRKRHADKVHKLAQKLDHEKTATLDAVDRIMKLQTHLQQYQMQYGPLE